ncbi:MAG: hypothetical protein H7067_14005, partial [Burkholderiales bacterium]|nr:hypothetical protein [Opitutaceae bacterium]
AAAPDARPFADGLPNLVRYALNLGPAPSASQLPAARHENGGNSELVMEFRIRKQLAGVALVPEYSADLALWLPVPEEQITRLADDDADTARHAARMPLTGGRVFLRLRATQP